MLKFQSIAKRLACLSSLSLCVVGAINPLQAAPEGDDTLMLLQPSTQTEAHKIVDNIYYAEGFGNTFLVVTEQGNVVVDTSMARSAAAHKALLDKVDARDPKYIIVTHGHADHVGGVAEWKGADTEVVMQQAASEFLHYQHRLQGFFNHRNAAQFGLDISKMTSVDANPDNFGAKLPFNKTFSDAYSFKLGELSFDIISTPSETHDALSVWIPERKAVFVGDLFYRAFPNLYTLRGTKPRWALDYVRSLDKVLALKPEIVIPSHGAPIYGAEAIEQALGQYRDAILYLHDAVVAGMNAGKSVDTLVAEIEMPKHLYIPEVYGQVDWSIRGIYLGYAGWFDGNPSTMLGVSSETASGELVELAGGADMVAKRAKQLYQQGEITQALSLADVVLSVQPDNAIANGIKIDIFKAKLAETKNFNAAGWLQHGVRQAKQALAEETQ